MSLEVFPTSASGQYRCQVPLNLYDSPTCQGLATQAAQGRHLQVLSETVGDRALSVRLCEDGYVAWLLQENLTALEPVTYQYQAVTLSRTEIEQRLPAVIAFVLAAMEQPNYYLWGVTLGPNYYCSGLMQ